MKTQTRRQFIKKSVVLSLAGFVLPSMVKARSQKPILRFGVIADSHYAQRPTERNRYYKQSIDKMQECISVFNNENLDFAIHLGDFKDQAIKPKTKQTLEFLTTIETEFTRFKGPVYHVVGNHDVDSITKTQFLKNVTNTGVNTNLSYYSFDIQDFHFVVLDANYDETGKDHFYLEGVDWRHCFVPDFQLQWLQNDLQNTTKPTLVFIHHPIFEYYREGVKLHVDNYENVQNILEKSGQVMAVFQGHVHEERMAQKNNIHYITHLGMVDYSGLENNSFSIVEIYPDQIQIHGYKRSGNFVLS